MSRFAEDQDDPIAGQLARVAKHTGADNDGRRGRVFSLRLSAEDEKTITDNLRRAQEWQQSLPWDKRPAGWSYRALSLGGFMVWAASTWSAPAAGKTKRRARRPRRAGRAARR